MEKTAMGTARVATAILMWGLSALAVIPRGWCEKYQDDMGRWIEISAPPQRVVTLAPSLAEVMFALGLEEHVVGVTEYTNYPPQAALRPKVGSYVHLQLESIVGLRPDLVLATREGNPRYQIEHLERLGVKVFVTDPRSLDGLFKTILSLGELFSRSAQARVLVQGMRSQLEAITKLTSSKPKPRVLLQVGANPLIVAGADTIQDHLIHLAGGDNVAASQGKGYPALSLEKVIALRPEVILISSMANNEAAQREREQWLRWRDLPAVKTNRIHVLEGDLIDRPSPRVIQGLASIVRAIHPSLNEGVDEALEQR